MNKNVLFRVSRILGLMPVLLASCASQPLPPPAPNSMASKLSFLNDIPTINIYDLRMISVNDFLVVQAQLFHHDDEEAMLKSAPWFATLPVLIIGTAVQPLFSSSVSRNAIQYRFQWLDKNGMPVGNEENWKVLNFMPSQAQTIKGMATSKYAVDFKLEMKSNN